MYEIKTKEIKTKFWKIDLLISQVGPVHPVAHVHKNSLTGGVDGTLMLLLNSTLFESLVGRILTGFPIELIPRIPRTTTAVVCSNRLCSFSFRTFSLLFSYLIGSYYS